MSKRRIEIPASGYQPTKAEMNEPIVIGLSVDEAAQRVARSVTAPADAAEVSVADWRKRRKQAVSQPPDRAALLYIIPIQFALAPR